MGVAGKIKQPTLQPARYESKLAARQVSLYLFLAIEISICICCLLTAVVFYTGYISWEGM